MLKEYPTCFKDNFSLAYFTCSMANGGYRILQHEKCGSTKFTGSNVGFSFHEEGEKMCLLSYIADIPKP